jgi:hypothetical protein
MKKITPKGTRTFRTSNPLGRIVPWITSPTGSGRAATSSSPRAMASIRGGVSFNRSTSASVKP